MENRIIVEAAKTLQELRMQLHFQSKRLAELKKYRGMTLYTAKGHNNRIYNYVKPKGSQKRKYLGGNNNTTVKNIKEYRHLDRSVKDLKSNIALLDSLIRDFRSTDPESVNSRLPKTYQQTELHAGNVYNKGLDPRGAQWKKKKEAYKARFPIPHPEDLIEECLDGTFVRSKSEMVIANILIMAKIPFVYEYPYILDGIEYYLDFTILSTIDFETEIIIEHQGMMDLDWYQSKYLRTLTAALNNDLIPNISIFFTFDSPNNRFNSNQVMEILRGRIIDQPTAFY